MQKSTIIVLLYKDNCFWKSQKFSPLLFERSLTLMKGADLLSWWETIFNILCPTVDLFSHFSCLDKVLYKIKSQGDLNFWHLSLRDQIFCKSLLKKKLLLSGRQRRISLGYGSSNCKCTLMFAECILLLSLSLFILILASQ